MRNNKGRYQKQQQQSRHYDRSLETVVQDLEIEGSETRTKVDLITEKLSDLSEVIRGIGPSLENALKAHASETDRKFDHVWDKIESNKPNWASWIVILLMMFGVGGTLVAFKADSVIEPIVAILENQKLRDSRLETRIDDHIKSDGHPVIREKLAATDAKLELHSILLTKVDEAVDVIQQTRFERADADRLIDQVRREQQMRDDYKDKEVEWVKREFELRTKAQEAENRALRAELNAHEKATEASVEHIRNSQKAIEDYMLWSNQPSKK